MPAPVAVELEPHSAAWAATAMREALRLKTALSAVLVTVHHIGSTSIPGIVAKPIVDLIPEVTSLDALDAAKERMVALGYKWWGEYGMTGRRYCTFADPTSGKRSLQLHCFATGSPHITRHVALRDFMRRHPDKAHLYEIEKIRARDLHPQDSHAYSMAKSAWIVAMEAEAMAEWSADHS